MEDELMVDTEWHEQTTQLINRFGWKLCGVFGDKTHFPFIYTLGNHGRGLPELLRIGSDNGDALIQSAQRCEGVIVPSGTANLSSYLVASILSKS